MSKGKGLVKGLRRTLQTFFAKPVTVEYPRVKPAVDPRYRGAFAFDPEKCIACELCARACPNRVIRLKWEKGEGSGAGKRRVTEYRMEPGLCLFCGLCAEACPTKALAMTPRYELATRRREEAGLVAFGRQER
ncbi:MAG: NADH-quinone oxidoreductase subunit I [Bacillota bacterium]|nr:NADH-quinone oxidoreductase subunit I [Bacillota bacterium]